MHRVVVSEWSGRSETVRPTRSVLRFLSHEKDIMNVYIYYAFRKSCPPPTDYMQNL